MLDCAKVVWLALAAYTLLYWINRWYGLGSLAQHYLFDNVALVWSLVSAHPVIRFMLREHSWWEEITMQMERPGRFISSMLITFLAFFFISNLVQDEWAREQEQNDQQRLEDDRLRHNGIHNKLARADADELVESTTRAALEDLINSKEYRSYLKKRGLREENGLPISDVKDEADANVEDTDVVDDDIDKLEDMIIEADNQLANERRQIRRCVADEEFVEEEGKQQQRRSSRRGLRSDNQ